MILIRRRLQVLDPYLCNTQFGETDFRAARSTSHAIYLTRRMQDTLWLFNVAVENGPFIDDIPIKTTIYRGFSMAMSNNQMVAITYLTSLLESLCSHGGRRSANDSWVTARQCCSSQHRFPPKISTTKDTDSCWW